jgi:aminoglycoside N3'-acetyltransferase
MAGMQESIPELGQKEIVEGLHRLGVGPGSSLVVHSSLSSFGKVKGGADAVINALVETVTSSGTILMPSFNHDTPFQDGGSGIYDPAVTPTSNGVIPDRFWRRADVYRSLNPTHPFAAWGKNAQRYMEHHHRTLTMGLDSPLGLLLGDGGFGLLLGVGYGANTFHHVVEVSTGAACLGLRTEAYPVRLADGRHVEGRTWGWRGSSCPFTDGHRYAAEMVKQGLQVEATIGGCHAILFRLQDCYQVVAEILQEGKDGYPPCCRCDIRPRAVSQTLESDWDRQHETLANSSTAWDY